jgi:hypothetical protein
MESRNARGTVGSYLDATWCRHRCAEGKEDEMSNPQTFAGTRSNRASSTARSTIAAVVAVVATLGGVGTVAAHPHVAENASHVQLLANGQNHPGFQPVGADGLRLSCEGVLDPSNSGPAGYGLETAHHGPDAGTPGKGDGCYAVLGNPVDDNPAIN